jgi:hypothetical protein
MCDRLVVNEGCIITSLSLFLLCWCPITKYNKDYFLTHSDFHIKIKYKGIQYLQKFGLYIYIRETDVYFNDFYLFIHIYL